MNKLLIYLLPALAIAGPAFSQTDGKENTAPKGVRELFKPKQPHPSGSLLFAIFPREGSFKTQMMATAWEFVPSNEANPLTKRCIFGPSHWNADTLYGIDDESSVIRLQHKDGKSSPYGVRLYGIDYSTWDIRTYYQGKQAIGLGKVGEKIYMKIDNSPKVLNTKTGKFSKSSVNSVLTKGSENWLVELSGEKSKFGLLNPKSGEIVNQLKNFPTPYKFGAEISLDPAGNYALILGDYSAANLKNNGGFPLGLQFGKKSPLNQKLTLYNLKTDTSTDFMPTVFASAGSGRPILADGPELHLSEKEFRFTNLAPDKEGKLQKEWVVVDFKTQKETGRVAYSSWKAPVLEVTAEVSKVPDYLIKLTALFDGDVYRKHYNLTLAAMVHHKIIDLKTAKEPGKVRFDFASLSPDGNHLLTAYQNSFHYFDFVNKTHRAVAKPPELRNASMGVTGVRIP